MNFQDDDAVVSDNLRCWITIVNEEFCFIWNMEEVVRVNDSTLYELRESLANFLAPNFKLLCILLSLPEIT